MTLSIEHIVFDCDDAESLAAFWSKVLEHPVDAGGSPYFSTIGRESPDTGPALMFIKVPEPKQTKNRLHLDLTQESDAGSSENENPDWKAEVERIINLGAVQIAEHKEFGTHWITLRDPEGNEFDIGAGLD